MPNSSDIAAQNRFVLIAIRICAIGVAWIGLFPILISITIAIAQRDFLDEDILIPLMMGFGIIGIAVLFWLIAPWIARKVLPNPLRVLCPSCGFDLADVVSDRCNECGLALSEEFRTGTVLQGPAQAPPAKVFVLQGTMTGVARLFTAVAILPTLIFTLTFLIQTVGAFNHSYNDFFVHAVFILMSTLGVSANLMCLVPWVLPRWTGRRLCPTLLTSAKAPQETLINPTRSISVGVARLSAVILLFPATGFAVGFGIAFLGEQSSGYRNEETLAIFSGFSFVGFLGIALCAIPWLFPKCGGGLLVPHIQPTPTLPTATPDLTSPSSEDANT